MTTPDDNEARGMLTIIAERALREANGSIIKAVDIGCNYCPPRQHLALAAIIRETPVARITEWPHHVRAKITIIGDYEEIFYPIANATRGFDSALIKKLIAQHELVVAIRPGVPGGLAPLKGLKHFGLASAVVDFVARHDSDDGFAPGPPPEVSPVIDTTVFAFWCASGEEATELQRVYCGFAGHGRN
jgi:hypothetical protein